MTVCSICGWEDLIDQIDGLLDDDRYSFAEDTLVGIRDWVDENKHCTGPQKLAVNNIEASKE